MVSVMGFCKIPTDSPSPGMRIIVEIADAVLKTGSRRFVSVALLNSTSCKITIGFLASKYGTKKCFFHDSNVGDGVGVAVILDDSTATVVLVNVSFGSPL